MLRLPALLPIFAMLAFAVAPAQAATRVTVHNLTGRTLAISQPWAPSPEATGWNVQGFRHRLVQHGGFATFHLDLPGQELEAEFMLRRLTGAGEVHFQGLVIVAVSPEWREDPLPEPGAGGDRGILAVP